MMFSCQCVLSLSHAVYLIVLIPDLYLLRYFNCVNSVMFAYLFDFVLIYFPQGAMGCHAICYYGIN